MDCKVNVVVKFADVVMLFNAEIDNVQGILLTRNFLIRFSLMKFAVEQVSSRVLQCSTLLNLSKTFTSAVVISSHDVNVIVDAGEILFSSHACCP